MKTLMKKGLIRAELIRTGPVDMQVCIPGEWDDDHVKEFANGENPCGTDLGWQIRKEGHKLLDGAAERVPCKGRAGFVHVTLDV